MKRTSKMTKSLLEGGLVLLLGFTLVGHVAAQSEPTFASATFFGGAGDQRGTGISISNGAIYLSGNVQPDSAFVVQYAIPPGSLPVWDRPWGFGNFSGITSTNDRVYAAGESHPNIGGFNQGLTRDGVGGGEVKAMLVGFLPDGSPGSAVDGAEFASAIPSNFTSPSSSTNFFRFSGFEGLVDVATTVENGSSVVYAAAFGQPASFGAYVIAKYDVLGNFIGAATDSSVGIAFNSFFLPPGAGGSDAQGVTVLNGKIYLAGATAWAFEDSAPRAALWKYEPNLSLIFRQKDTSLTGAFAGITAFGGTIYAVGRTFTSGVPGSEDFLIQKYDEDGNLLWSQISGGANTDVLTDVVGIGSSLFAVGHTKSEGGGDFDVVILEIDPATGTTLSTTLFGGALADMATGAATDGTDLYVVGESRSFASDDGNAVGQNDVMLLQYTLEIPPEQATQNLIGDLQVIVDDNPGTELADEVEDAIEDAQEAFNALTETPPDNEAAVESIGEAVEGLQEAVDDGLLDAVLGTQLMDEFARVARQLAVDAINQAIAQGGDPEEIQEAEGALADGDADRASGAFEDALNNYEDALEKAEDAIS